jgi:hypothetical protein
MHYKSLLLLITLFLASSARGQEGRWPLIAERMLAADATFYAPPDLKRQIAKNRDRFMAGVNDSSEAEKQGRTPSQYREAASSLAVRIVSAIRQKRSFADAVYMTGGLLHMVAMSYPPPGPDLKMIEGAWKARSAFQGYPDKPFGARAAVFPVPPSAASYQAAYDSAVTAGTRFLAWIWDGAGGDAAIARQYPESKGPYGVR